MPMSFQVVLLLLGVLLSMRRTIKASRTTNTEMDEDEGAEDEGATKGTWKGIPSPSEGALIVSGVDPGDYTFMLRVLGVSDNDLGNTKKGEVGGMVASVEITVPMSAPTLPEIALLLLAMLLLGSGAYLLRRRQSGGLTAA